MFAVRVVFVHIFMAGNCDSQSSGVNTVKTAQVPKIHKSKPQGILLYFLLGHDTSSRTAYRYASWTLLTYRFGDLPLLVAAGLMAIPIYELVSTLKAGKQEEIRHHGQVVLNQITDKLKMALDLVDVRVLDHIVVTGEECIPEHLEALTDKMQECGFAIETTATSVTVGEATEWQGTDISTSPYPGFPTDLQAQFMALMTQAGGSSVITECIF